MRPGDEEARGRGLGMRSGNETCIYNVMSYVMCYKPRTRDYYVTTCESCDLIQIDHTGVAVGTEFCKPGSLEITSSSFWMFSTGT